MSPALPGSGLAVQVSEYAVEAEAEINLAGCFSRASDRIGDALYKDITTVRYPGSRPLARTLLTPAPWQSPMARLEAAQNHPPKSPAGERPCSRWHPGLHSPLNIERVERAVAARELDFPIAVDWDWRNGTLKDWWLTGPDRPATPVTFLLDKSGVIQYVHPGMEYHEIDDVAHDSGVHAMCANDMVGIRSEIIRLLDE